MYSPIIDGHHPNWTLLSFINKTLLHGHRRSTVRRSILPLTEPTVQVNHTRTESPSAEIKPYLKLDTTRRDVFLFTNRTLLYGFRRSTFKCRNTETDVGALHESRAEPCCFGARKYTDKTSFASTPCVFSSGEFINFTIPLDHIDNCRTNSLYYLIAPCHIYCLLLYSYNDTF